MTTMTITFTQAHTEALEAAKKAGQKYFTEVLGSTDRYACGFAWVRMPHVKLNTKLGKEAQSVGFSKSYNKGAELWNPSGLHCQNIDAKEAGADAYAKVMQQYGFEVYSESRLD